MPAQFTDMPMMQPKHHLHEVVYLINHFVIFFLEGIVGLGGLFLPHRCVVLVISARCMAQRLPITDTAPQNNARTS
jgi:hypothetical protein